MKELKIKVYSLDELSSYARERAKREWQENTATETVNSISSEYIESIKLGLKHFNCFMKDWSIDPFNSSVSNVPFSIHPPRTEEIEGVRLWKYLHNNNLLEYRKEHKLKAKQLLDGNCPFTGICTDENFLDPVREFVKKPTDISYRDLMKDCVESTLQAMEKDSEYHFSDEAFEHFCADNDMLFLSNGEIAPDGDL